MTSFLCNTCGTQFPESDAPPHECPICEDDRQYVPAEGQQWVTYDEVCRKHHAEIREEQPQLSGIGMEPSFGISQRALLVESPGGNVLWDCLPLLDEMAAFVESRGGLRAIAISHPHYYTTMVEWAHAFACPILIHEADRKWVMRPDPAIRPWQGETHDLGGGVTLIRCGGHFDGGQVLHWRERGALLSGDIVHVIPDRRFVGFMYSYPNVIPLPPSKVQAIGAALEPFAFETIHGAWWGSVVERDGSGVVRRSVDRYVRAVTDPGLAS
ncbi:MAG: MBL fold metallo-hydrolase [Gaiellaceae bacterium]